MVLEGFVEARKIIDDLKEALKENDKNKIDPLIGRLNFLYERSNLVTRYGIIIGVASIGHNSLLRLFKMALKDESALIRHEAVFGIGEVGDTSCQDLLINLLSDSESIVRHEAAVVLGDNIGDASCLNSLSKLSKDDDKVVAESSIYAIESIKFREQQKIF